jgi:predicted alpha/beta-hydrolase family hydrolase
VLLGYPLHPPGRPNQLRVAHLKDVRRPMLIVQGERDAFGSPEDVRGYRLSKAIRLEWLPYADHSFRPRKASGFTLEDHMDTAAQLAADFVRAQFGA